MGGLLCLAALAFGSYIMLNVSFHPSNTETISSTTYYQTSIDYAEIISKSTPITLKVTALNDYSLKIKTDKNTKELAAIQNGDVFELTTTCETGVKYYFSSTVKYTLSSAEPFKIKTRPEISIIIILWVLTLVICGLFTWLFFIWIKQLIKDIKSLSKKNSAA